MRKLFGVVAGIAGICLVIGMEAFGGLGRNSCAQLAIVAATVCYAGAAIFGRGFKGLDPMMPAAGSMICGAAILVPLSLVVDRPWTLAPSAARSLALLGAVGVLDRARLRDLLPADPYAGHGRHDRAGLSARADRRRASGCSSSARPWPDRLDRPACVVVGVAAMTIPARPPRPDAGGRLARPGLGVLHPAGICLIRRRPALPYFLLDPRVRRGLLLLWGALWWWVAYMSLTPVQLPPGLSDKVLHFTGYALMSAVLKVFAMSRGGSGLLALLAAVIGGAVEIAQAFTPDRSPELLDFAADSAGAALGWLMALAWLALVVRPLRRRPAPADGSAAGPGGSARSV